MGSTYKHVVSRESAPGSLGTVWLQHMHTAISIKTTDDLIEYMQTSHGIISCIMTQVL